MLVFHCSGHSRLCECKTPILHILECEKKYHLMHIGEWLGFKPVSSAIPNKSGILIQSKRDRRIPMLVSYKTDSRGSPTTLNLFYCSITTGAAVFFATPAIGPSHRMENYTPTKWEQHRLPTSFRAALF